MLKQILKAGYIDPELLDLLTDEQKDVVFKKMREEQVRKWSEREALILEKKLTIERIPKINFKIATDGNPWVWVMGDDHKDLSYEGIILKREREKEQEEEERLRKEAEELAQHETRDILLAPADKLEVNPQSLARTESVMDNVVDVDTSKSKNMWKKAVSNRSKILRRMSIQEQDDYEKRRADEIYENMLHSVQVKKKRVAEIVVESLKQWREAEQTAKLHDEKVRRRSLRLKQGKFDFSTVDQVFEKLPEAKKQALQKRLSDHAVKRDSVFTSQSKPLSEAKRQMFRQSSFSDDPETRPKTMQHAIKWFIEYERPKGIGMDIDGTISLWFHGSIDKREAEKILLSKPAGMFLLRISCKVWGYTVSVRTMEKVKHYVLLATGGKYRFLGTDQPEFGTLVLLLKYYKFNPITWAGQEILLLPCEQTNEQLKIIQTLFEVEDVEDEETAM